MIIIIASMFGPIVEAHWVIIVKMEGLEEVRPLEYIKTRLGQGSLGWEEWLGGGGEVGVGGVGGIGAPEEQPPDEAPRWANMLSVDRRCY